MVITFVKRMGVIVCMVFTACLGCGDEADSPEPSAKATGAPDTETSGFQLSSTAFENGAFIPEKYTCNGVDVSPPLAWKAFPERTAAFAIVCEDPDAPVGTWIHWVLYDIPAGVAALGEGVPGDTGLINGAKQGRNDFKDIGYGGPCPPSGKPHRYFFELFALDAPTGLPPGATRSQLMDAIKGHVLAETRYMGKFQR